MKNPTFYIVDVFAEEKYAGNQLAVVRGAGHLPDAEMQKIASEMNYSETAFILSEEEKDGGYDVRIFTPGEEIPFAGHPTLGTAFRVEQGYEIGRPSLLYLRAWRHGGEISVSVGGKVQMVAKGELL